MRLVKYNVYTVVCMSERHLNDFDPNKFDCVVDRFVVD